MITKERLMELLVQAGSEIGILPKRMPAGWQRFGELVEAEALKVRGISDHPAPTPVNDLGVWSKLGQAVQADQCPHAAVPSSCSEVQCFMTKTCLKAVKVYGGAPGGGKSESHQLGEFVKLHPWVSVLDNPHLLAAFRAWRITT